MIATSSMALLAAGIHPLATANALLNATATLLLITGYVQIKRARERAHKRIMLSAFVVSCAFLTSYLAYHIWPVGAKSVPFTGQGPIRAVYFSILISHVILAGTVPILAGITIFLGLKDWRVKHRRVARWTFPIWLYVSVTGVVIYLMLYHLYEPAATGLIMPLAASAAG